MSWHELAACREMPQGMFFPEAGTNPEAAQAVCETCDVQAECLAFALTTGQHEGIWGGLTATERARQRKYRVIFCSQCGRRFVWKPAEVKDHTPKFCSSVCRNQARRVSQQRWYHRAKEIL